jgi:hypothetical protein
MTGSSGSNIDRSEPDPFLHLHKMSTTAGLGSGDYVAINGCAIAAILLGVGSAIVLFNNLIFLIIPLLGVIAGLLAFKQIAESNGTQTGREVAAVGLLLSLAFGGFYSAKTVYATFRNRSDEEQIVSNVRKLGELVKSQSFPEAYALFDDRFKKRVPLAVFETGWRRVTNSPVLGQVQSLDWNHLLAFDIDPVDGSQIATGMMLLKGKPQTAFRMNMGFRNEGSGWLIDQLPQLFPADAPAPASGGGTTATGASGPKNSSSTFIGPPKPQ